MTLNRLLSRLEHAFIRQRQFVSDAAHELATPLSSIRGHIGILKNWGSADAAVRQETIEHIDQSSQRMVVLIDELLALATLDEESVIKCQEFSVKSAIDQVVGRFAKSGQAEINVLVEKGATVSADRQRFERLIIILLDNALKYTPTAGKVVIGAERKGDRLTAYVSDTGIGIPSKDLPRIFDRFYRSDKARARKTGGSGLGLAIAKSIVEAHGGKISVESVQGEGSSIRFWLPNAHDKYSS
jgi:signal transduction histidine kinase